MPELPEVETVCRGLAQHLLGKKITQATVRRRDLRVPVPDNFETSLMGRTVTSITRRAKYVLIHLDDAQVFITHLGMSGSLVLHDKKSTEFRKHDHVIVEFSPYKMMVFHDTRRFGLMALATQETLQAHKLFAGLGKEPFDESMTSDYFYTLLQTVKAPIKLAIMDQAKIVGVGNIYAAESLFRSRIHPERPANQVTKKEAGILLRNIKQVLEEAIESGGSTLRDYVRSSGDSGYFQHNFSVYGRKGEPCVACEAPIQLIRQSGRSTFFCAHCQK